MWLLRCNNDKFKVLRLGKNNPDSEERQLEVSNCEKDLGVHVDPLLNFEKLINNTEKKTRKVSDLILRHMINKTQEIMVLLF